MKWLKTESALRLTFDGIHYTLYSGQFNEIKKAI